MNICCLVWWSWTSYCRYIYENLLLSGYGSRSHTSVSKTTVVSSEHGDYEAIRTDVAHKTEYTLQLRDWVSLPDFRSHSINVWLVNESVVVYKTDMT